jgi:TolA-binding protein
LQSEIELKKENTAVMAKITKKEASGLEFIESPEALANEIGKVQHTIEKNKNIFTYVGGGLLLAALAFVGYKWYAGQQDTEGQAALFPLVAKFEADSTKNLAKDLVKIADEYGMSKAGNLAHFYAGVASLKEGKYDQAIEQLKGFASSDLLVQARAYALLGDAYSEKKDYAEAAEFYKKAAEYKPNKFFTPNYLIKLATAYEAAKENDKALEAYSTIVEKYEDSQEAAQAKKYKSKLEGAAAE